LTLGQDKPPTLWDVNAPRPRAAKVLLHGAGAAQELATFDPTGRWLFLGGKVFDKTLASGGRLLVDLRRNDPAEKITRIPSGTTESLENVEFSPKGSWIVLRPNGKPVRVHQIDDRMPMVIGSPFVLEESSANAGLWFNGDETSIIGGAMTGSLLWDRQTQLSSVKPKLIEPNEIIKIRLDSTVVARTLHRPDGLMWLNQDGFTTGGEWFSRDYRYRVDVAGNKLQFWDLRANPPTSVRTTFASNMNIMNVPKVSFSSDGRWLIADGSLFRIRDGKLENMVRKEEHASFSASVVQFAGGERRAVMLGAPSHVWDLTTENAALTPVALEGPMQLSPDGRWLVERPRNRPARIWDLVQNPPTDRAAVLLPGEPVTHVESFNDAKSTAFASADGTIRVRELSSKGKTTGSEKVFGDGRAIRTLRSSPSGRWLLVSDDDNNAILFRHARGEPLVRCTLAADVDYPSRVGIDSAFAPDESWLVSRNHQRSALDIVDLKAQAGSYAWVTPVPWPSEPHVFSSETQFVGEGRFLLTTGGSYDPRLVDLRDPRATALPRELAPSGDYPGWVQFSPDNRWLVASSSTKIDIWNLGLEQSRPVVSVSHGRGNGSTIGTRFPPVLSPDSHWLFASTHKGVLLAFSLSGDQPVLRELPVEDADHQLERVAFSPAGRWVVTSCRSKDSRQTSPGVIDRLRVWDLKGGTSLPHLEIPGKWTEFRFRSEGELLALTRGAKGTKVLAWDLSQGLPEVPVPAVEVAERPGDAALTQNGRWIVFSDGRLLDAQTKTVHEIEPGFSTPREQERLPLEALIPPPLTTVAGWRSIGIRGSENRIPPSPCSSHGPCFMT
jgi:WD40 repeat protein